MIRKHPQYTFTLFSYVYFHKIENKSFILYNTKTGESIENKSEIYCSFISRIYDPVNLGIIYLNQDDLRDNETCSFINEVISKNMGRLTEKIDNNEKLINLLPTLNLQSDIDKLKENDEFSIGENLLNYLNELNIYINNSCDSNCTHCNTYYKHAKSCNKSERKSILDISVVKGLLDSLKYSSLKKINILGGDVFQYPYLEELASLLNSYDFEFHIWMNYLNWSKNKGSSLNKIKAIFNLIVSLPLDSISRKDLQTNIDNSIIHFFVESETQVEEIEKICKKQINYNLVPIYTGINKNFFEEYIYISKEDIFEGIIPHRTIFCNQKLNSNHFGKLYIMPDGRVKANQNEVVLGNIHHSSILEMIYIELNENTAWRKIRSTYPCNKCLYQYLCPPLSNYENIIGQNNLCHIK